MFKEEFQATANAARAKVNLLKNNPLGYFILAILAGMYIGFGALLMLTISGALAGQPYAKVIMGCCFGIALSLVVIAGAELFTGNNLVMAAGMLKKTISISEGVKLWIICWIGNLIGGVILSVLFQFSGLSNDVTGPAIASAALAKMTIPPVALFIRGILCNMLVCIAVWCGIKCKSESGKLIMIFWCLFAFITTGFEHSIANMTTLTAALLNPCGQAVTLGGWVYNLIIVTLGNMVGGILFVAVPYFLASKDPV